MEDLDLEKIESPSSTEKKYFIYKHTCVINGKSYIGQTAQNPPQKRWSGVPKRPYHSHKSIKTGRFSKFESAINKYGWENFTHEILCECTASEVDKLESYYISYYDTLKNGYNSDSGGSSGPKEIDEKTRELHRQAGYKHTISEEGRKNISKGVREYRLGTSHTSETKLKMQINNNRAALVEVIDINTGEKTIYNSFVECYEKHKDICSRNYGAWVEAAKFGRIIDNRWKVTRLGLKREVDKKYNIDKNYN